jgi:hypothetical protein
MGAMMYLDKPYIDAINPPATYAVFTKRLVVISGGGVSVCARNSGYVTIGGMSRGCGGGAGAVLIGLGGD